MDTETFSVVLQGWRDLQTDIFQLRVTRVDTGEELHLDDGSFLLRVSFDTEAALLRCLVRHIASGRETYIQSGPGLREFVNACLLASAQASSPSLPSAEVSEMQTEQGPLSTTTCVPLAGIEEAQARLTPDDAQSLREDPGEARET